MPNWAELIGKLIVPGKARLYAPLAKELGAMLNDEVAESAVIYGTIKQAQVRVGWLTGKEAPAITDEALRATVWKGFNLGDHYIPPEVRPATDGVRGLAWNVWKQVDDLKSTVQVKKWVPTGEALVKRIQEQPIGLIEPYAPHFLNKDVALAFKKDGDLIFNYAADKSQNWEKYFNPNRKRFELADMDALDEGVKKFMPGMDERTQHAINLLVGRDGVSHGEAMTILRDRAEAQIANPFGVLRKSRTLNLPDEFYESDPYKAWDTYFRGAAKHIARMKTWGANDQLYKEKFLQLSQVAPKEARVIEKLESYIHGTAEFQVSEGFKKFSRGFTAFETGTKIGLGTATLPNLVQLGISTFAKVGYLKGLAATLKAFTPEGKAIARETGIQGFQLKGLEALAGIPEEYMDSGPLVKLMKYHPGMKLFERVNRFNNTVSAIAGEDYLKGLYRQSRRGSKYASETLQKFGIDPAKELDHWVLRKGQYRFATDMQLQKNVLNDPLWMNDPKFRFLALFKRFGLRQTAMVYDHFLKDFVKSGNPLPLMRLGAAGVMGGAFTLWAKDAIRKGLFNAPDAWKDEDKGIFQQGMFWLAQSGTFGMVGDLAGRVKGFELDKVTDSMIDNLYYAATPVLVSELYDMPGSQYKGWLNLANNFAIDFTKPEEGGIKTAMQNVGPEMLAKFSPITKYAGDKIKADRKVDKETRKLLTKLYRENTQ
jgi:hypothetical protein